MIVTFHLKNGIYLHYILTVYFQIIPNHKASTIIDFENMASSISFDSIPGNKLSVVNDTVYWTNNGIFLRKFSFPDSTNLKAVFVDFPQYQKLQKGNAHSKRAIAILNSAKIHIYFIGGSFHIVKPPFVTSSISSCPYGLILSRNFGTDPTDTEEYITKFYLLSNPLSFCEPIYPFSLTNISYSEEIVHFGASDKVPFCICYDPINRLIKIYHVRKHNARFHGSNILQLESKKKGSSAFNINMKHKAIIPEEYPAPSLMFAIIDSFQSDLFIQNPVSISSTYFEEYSTITLNEEDTISTMIFSNEDANTTKLVNTYEFPGISSANVKLPNGSPILVILNSPDSFYFADLFLQVKSKTFLIPQDWIPINRLEVSSEEDEDDYLYAIGANKFYNLETFLFPKNFLPAIIFQALYQYCNPVLVRMLHFEWAYLQYKNISINEWESFSICISTLIFSSEKLKAIAETTQNSNSNLLNKICKTPESVDFGDFSTNHEEIERFTVDAIIVLHYLREELKVQSGTAQSVESLGELLAFITTTCGWTENWTNFYGIKFGCNIPTLFSTPQPFSVPPNILLYLESLFLERGSLDFPLLSEIFPNQNHIDNENSLTPNIVKLIALFSSVAQSRDLQTMSSTLLEKISQLNLTKQSFRSFSNSIQHILFNCISCITTIPSSFLTDKNLLNLLGRDDLLLSALFTTLDTHVSNVAIGGPIRDPQKDITSLIASMGDSEFVTAWDEQSETDNHMISKLIFSTDRRFYEASKLLQSSKPRVITINEASNWSEADLLAKQEEAYYSSVLRTCTVPIGRAAFHYSGRKPLVTEKYPIPKLNFTVVVKPRDITLNTYKTIISEENLSWGFFYNGVAAGLSLSKEATYINGNWIAFNKPSMLNSQHAGFLLGLGLNGHLSQLEEWHIYNYLGPKHSHTSIALLIGMAASNLRSMDTKLTKVLSVHIFALLPMGSNDLNVSVEVQTAGVIGMGLLYLETSHRRMSETFLGELESRSRVYTEESIRLHTNESYKLAAGISLGLINLGKGNDLLGLNDIKIVERLLTRATSVRDVQTLFLEISLPGSLMSLILMFLRSKSAEIAKKISPPETSEAYDYIRPDLLLLRALGAQVIMWDSIGSSKEWIESQIPPVISQLLQTKSNGIFSEFNSDTISYYYIKAGLVMAMALKYSSSGDESVRDVIIDFLDKVVELSENSATTHDQLLVKHSLLHIQNTLCLSASIVMTGTGDLKTLRRLRRLSLQTRKDTCGVNIAVHMSLGILFLGGGQYRFGHDNLSIACLIISLYPIFPRVLVDNSSYLQPLRYFWALAAKPNCAIVREVETGQPCVVDLVIELKNGDVVTRKSPCLLPSMKSIKTLSTISELYHSVNLDFTDTNTPLTKGFLKTLTIYVSKKRTFMSTASKILINKNNSGTNSLNSGLSSLGNILSNLNALSKIDLERIEANGFSLWRQSLESCKADAELANYSTAQNPKSNDDLWHMRLMFIFNNYMKQNKLYNDNAESLKVEEMKTLLWKWNASRSNNEKERK